jgi:ORF6N domain
MPDGIAEGMNRLRIFELRDEAVVLDSVLAAIYGVTTANFDKVIRRNLHPFPNDFLTRKEFADTMVQTGTSKRRGGRRRLLGVFTERGALMAANAAPENRLSATEKTLLGHDMALRDFYHKIRRLFLPQVVKSKRRMGFHPEEEH